MTTVRDEVKDKLFEIEFRLNCLKELHKATKSDGFIPLIKSLEEKRAVLLSSK